MLLEVTPKRNQETYAHEQLLLYEIMQYVKRQGKEIILPYLNPFSMFAALSRRQQHLK